MEEILASIRKIIADEPEAPPAAAAEEVLELTQAVQDDGSVVDLQPAPEASPAPPPPPPPPSSPAAAKKPEAAPASDLVSENAAKATATALSSLANTVEIERLSAAPIPTTFLGNGAKTLEEMVTDLMRPILKEWLDKNLPATVDRLVQREIEHISRKAQKD